MSLFFPNIFKEGLIGFADAGYLSDPHNGRSQTGYLFTCGDCGLSSGKEAPTLLYEDNATCIAQLKEGYIKGDRTKHISPKFFFTHELQKTGDVNILQIHSSENLADLFTKALPTATSKKFIHLIGLGRLKDLQLNCHYGE
ncbi:uncharacterized protein [Spinacia oleracea]|uniref:Uncharacterized protein n=1 Tax=Spinacia oleracea TaxID=3562 RepID=A0ABM3R8U7_SPIOL|nr:uncharacterized protein LOC130467528 [Spinacia oleracea]